MNENCDNQRAANESSKCLGDIENPTSADTKLENIPESYVTTSKVTSNYSLKQNEAQSARAESTHKGVN